MSGYKCWRPLPILHCFRPRYKAWSRPRHPHLSPQRPHVHTFGVTGGDIDHLPPGHRDRGYIVHQYKKKQKQLVFLSLHYTTFQINVNVVTGLLVRQAFNKVLM